MQALWAVHDDAMTELTLPFLDAELAGWQYPFASLAAPGRGSPPAATGR